VTSGGASAKRRLADRGQSLVEFALVFPLALLLILAVFDVGRAVFVYNGLTNAAREGVRLAIVNQDEDLIGERVQDMAIGTAVSNLGVPDPGEPALVEFLRADPDDGTTTDDACPTIVTGCVAVVTAQADWSAITPIIGTLMGPIKLEAQSELAIEFVCPNASIPAYASSASCPKQP
jgi:Flp pilus assembly protein TadG